MKGRKRLRLGWADGEIDLVPLIDCVFLLLLFFLLCGRLTLDQRPEQITVPPGKTAHPIVKGERPREVISVSGLHGERATLELSGRHFAARPGEDGYAALRALLDHVWDAAEKRPDARSGLQLPQVTVEIRADGDADFRVVQELEQVVADCVDPVSMQAKSGARRPFVDVDFTARKPDGN
jgi:hypothetical protein